MGLTVHGHVSALSLSNLSISDVHIPSLPNFPLNPALHFQPILRQNESLKPKRSERTETWGRDQGVKRQQKRDVDAGKP